MPVISESGEASSEDCSSPSANPGQGGVKTSSDWMSLFLGTQTGNGLDSPSLYSSVTTPTAEPSANRKMYERSYSSSSGYSHYPSGSSYGGSRYISNLVSSSVSTSAYASSLSYGRSSSLYDSSRYRSRRYYTRDEERENERNRESSDQKQDDRNEESESTSAEVKDDSNGATEPEGNHDTKKKSKHRATVINGSVIRIRRNRDVSESSDGSSDEEEDDEVEAETAREATPPAPPTPPTPPPPEDPLDVEERMLNVQLTLSLTLTMTDEENIRQRLVEIRKTRLRRTEAEVERALVEKFHTESEALGEMSRAKEEEEKILLQRLKAESIREVEQKDIQVRLQELFRDRKLALEINQKNMEALHQRMLQETSAEISALDSSIREKQQEVERLQSEIMSSNVRKELLSSGLDKIEHRRQELLLQLQCQSQEIDTKMSEYAVLAPARPSARAGAGAGAADRELRELEEELECPVCMDLARPPIYQCEEGHIICSACKPLLTSCPHCAKTYSNPVIRCRFAEKLSDRYFRMVQEAQCSETGEGRVEDEAEYEEE